MNTHRQEASVAYYQDALELRMTSKTLSLFTVVSTSKNYFPSYNSECRVSSLPWHLLFCAPSATRITPSVSLPTSRSLILLLSFYSHCHLSPDITILCKLTSLLTPHWPLNHFQEVSHHCQFNIPQSLVSFSKSIPQRTLWDKEQTPRHGMKIPLDLRWGSPCPHLLFLLLAPMHRFL